MKFQQLLTQTYWGRADGKDPGSLKRFANVVRNSRVKKEAKDFRATTSFLANVRDAHLLASLFRQAGVTSWQQYTRYVAKFVAKKDFDFIKHFERHVDQVVSPMFDTELITSRRDVDDELRDYPREAAVLLTRDLLFIRDYEDAVKSGDSGRLEKVVEIWSVEYQPTKKSNYQRELIHLVACLKKIWTPVMRKHWLDNCLVNPSGRPGGWQPDDLFGEYIIRENKD